MNKAKIMWGKSDPVNICIHTKYSLKEYELPEDIVDDAWLWSFSRSKVKKDCYILANVDRVARPNQGTDVAQCTVVKLVDEGEDWDSHTISKDFYIRNKKLYLRSAAKSPIGEWKTSLRLLCTAFFKILSNEIYCKEPAKLRMRDQEPAKLRMRAIVCMVVVPAVALMGVLMPFASYYFNRIVGDLDCWLNRFNNSKLSVIPFESRETQSSRCFAVDLQPYAGIDIVPNDDGDIDIHSIQSADCARRLVEDIRVEYINGNEITIRKDGILSRHITCLGTR